MTLDKSEKHINGYFSVAEELLKMEKAELNDSTRKALSHFIQDVIIRAVSTAHLAFGTKIPLFVRKKSISLLMGVDKRYLRPKTILCCIVPEIMILKSVIRKACKAS